jgi:hypothetical protein
MQMSLVDNQPNTSDSSCGQVITFTAGLLAAEECAYQVDGISNFH